MCLSRTSCKHNTVYLGGWQTGSATQAISDHTEEWFTCLACRPAKSRAVTSVMRVGLTKMVSPIFFFFAGLNGFLEKQSQQKLRNERC